MILTYNLLHKKIEIDCDLALLGSNAENIINGLKTHERNKVKLDLAESYTNLFFEREQKKWDGKLTITLFDRMIKDLKQQNETRRFTAAQYPSLVTALEYAKDTSLFLIACIEY